MGESCPFCGESAIRKTVQGIKFRCGTFGPDSDGDYDTGHACDITTWSRVLAEKDAEIDKLRSVCRHAAEDLDTAEDVTLIQNTLHQAAEGIFDD